MYAFGSFVLEPDEKRLLRQGVVVHLKPKAFGLLVALVARHGHLVTKQELLDLVWPGVIVEEANLTYTISGLRKVLGDGLDGTSYIETVATRGYRFVAPVRIVESGAVLDPHPLPWWRRRGTHTAFLAGATSMVALAALLAMAPWPRATPIASAGPPAMFTIPLPETVDPFGATPFPFPSPDGSP